MTFAFLPLLFVHDFKYNIVDPKCTIVTTHMKNMKATCVVIAYDYRWDVGEAVLRLTHSPLIMHNIQKTMKRNATVEQLWTQNFLKQQGSPNDCHLLL